MQGIAPIQTQLQNTLIHSTKRFNFFALSVTHCVEAVVDEMLQVFAHSNLPHELVLVAVHASQLTDMGEDVLQSI